MNNAIVVTYEGVTPSEVFIQSLGASISEAFAFGGGEVTVTVLDKDSIAKAILKRAVDSANLAIKEIKTPAINAIDQAAIFFREKFADEIATHNSVSFALHFSTMLSDAKARKAFNPDCVSEEDEALINATEIICKNAKDVAAKRKLPNGIVGAINLVASKL